jgi:GntR family transcriptional regulator
MTRLQLPALSSASPDPLYQQIVNGIRREISEGRVPAGMLLPSFRELAAELLVSLITVKRAYADLEREGLIYRRQGLGTFVAARAQDLSREAKADRARDLLRDALREAREAGLDEDELEALLRTVRREKGRSRR